MEPIRLERSSALAKAWSILYRSLMNEAHGKPLGIAALRLAYSAAAVLDRDSSRTMRIFRFPMLCAMLGQYVMADDAAHDRIVRLKNGLPLPDAEAFFSVPHLTPRPVFERLLAGLRLEMGNGPTCTISDLRFGTLELLRSFCIRQLPGTSEFADRASKMVPLSANTLVAFMSHAICGNHIQALLLMAERYAPVFRGLRRTNFHELLRLASPCGRYNVYRTFLHLSLPSHALDLANYRDGFGRNVLHLLASCEPSVAPFSSFKSRNAALHGDAVFLERFRTTLFETLPDTAAHAALAKLTTTRSDDGLTPIESAARQHNTSMIEFLLPYRWERSSIDIPVFDPIL